MVIQPSRYLLIICLLSLSILSCVITGSSQSHDPLVEGWISQVHIDSLTSFVRILSGEDSVRIGDTTVLIKQRASKSGRDLAADYIKEKLTGYGLDVYDQTFGLNGRNVFAVQTGTAYPDKEFIVCAHYDAVTDFAADDNASGVAGVLEAARILSTHNPDYTIVYGLWDQEEIGLIGSSHYASLAVSYGWDIQGVVNLDMIGWDGNGDGLCEVHARDIGNSMSLAGMVLGIDSVYSLQLNPILYYPGATASDHASFWFNGFTAVLLIEASRSGDFNPYYHTSSDRIDKYDLTYFLNMARLVVGSISTLAYTDPIVAVREDVRNIPSTWQIRNYPNPFNISTIVRYDLPEDDYAVINVYNSAGEKVAELLNGFQTAGSHEMEFSGIDLSTGVYFMELRSDEVSIRTKMLLLK